MTAALNQPKTTPFTDLPPPLGEVVAEYRIAAGDAIAYAVTAGQYIQIIDVAGSQCSDFLAMGYEFDDLISPYQAGIGWAVAMKKPDFIGKAALEEIRRHPPRAAGVCRRGTLAGGADHQRHVFAHAQRQHYHGPGRA